MNHSYFRCVRVCIWVVLLTAGVAELGAQKKSQAPSNGIFVPRVETFDEGSLESLLSRAQQNLAALNAFDQGVTKQIGTIQGATLSQTGVALSGGTATPPAQTAPSTPSLPTTPATSASNFLNEELQLGLQIVNMQLLLQGPLNDQSTQGGLKKVRTTLGFPINITTPPGFKYQGAVAEVRVSICAPRDTIGTPDLSILLPQEKTYNVASLVSKNASIGGGATIAGVINLGGSFLRGRQSYFIVKDQDTLATQLAPDGTCDNGKPPLTFAWQFRPVLGQKVVQSGLRQTFAQISFTDAITSYLFCDMDVTLKSVWRRYDTQTGRVGDPIDPVHEVRLPAITFNLPPVPDTNAEFQDNGDGKVTVLAHGAFKTSTRVRIGSTLLDSTSTGFELNKMGYLLHSGDPKILWLRTARFARRPGKTHPPFALEASGALPTGGGDFCGTWRRAVPIQADTVGHAHSNGLASPGHRQPRPQPVGVT